MSAAQNLKLTYERNAAYDGIDRRYLIYGDLPVEFIRMRQPEIEAEFDDRDDLAIVLGWDISGETVVDFGEGRMRVEGRSGFYVNPVGGNYWFRQTGPAEVLVISVRLDRLADSFSMTKEAFVGAVRPLHDRMLIAPHIADWTKRLWLTAQQEGAFAALAVDHGLLGLVSALLNQATDPHYRRDEETSISAAKLSRCFEFIESALEQTIRLHDLANALEMPSSRFLTRFKATTGQTPHQYLLSRRIARAQELLTASNMPLVEIAYACGFASQSHMTDVFRQKLGVTPGRYRKDVRS